MTNFCQEQLPCGCIPGYKRCEHAERMQARMEAFYRANKNKSQHDPIWLEYDRMKDEYLEHIKMSPVGIIREVDYV